jgi:hypothetical protein
MAGTLCTKTKTILNGVRIASAKEKDTDAFYGVHSVFEDLFGSITNISFYHMIDPITPNVANQVFPKGTQVVILNPNYIKRLVGR